MKYILTIIVLLVFSCKKENGEKVLHHISFIGFNYFNSVVYFNYNTDLRLTRFYWGQGRGNSKAIFEYNAKQLLMLTPKSGFGYFDTLIYELDITGLANSDVRKFNSSGQIIKTTIDDTLIYNSEGDVICWSKENGQRRYEFEYYNDYDNTYGIYQIDEWNPIWITGVFGKPNKKLIKRITSYYNDIDISSENYRYVFENEFKIKVNINGSKNGYIEYVFAIFNEDYESP